MNIFSIHLSNVDSDTYVLRLKKNQILVEKTNCFTWLANKIDMKEYQLSEIVHFIKTNSIELSDEKIQFINRKIEGYNKNAHAKGFQ